MTRTERKKLNDAVNAFAEEMKARLFAKGKDGWHGWEHPSKWDVKERMLVKAGKCITTPISKDLVDIANFAMMLKREMEGGK